MLETDEARNRTLHLKGGIPVAGLDKALCAYSTHGSREDQEVGTMQRVTKK